MERKEVLRQLQEALAADDIAEKNYHIRQALQLLGLENAEE